MIGGNPKIKVTKTDVCRWLNDHGDHFPELVILREQYMEKCNRARRLTVSQFGFWLKEKRPTAFNKLAKKLSKDPSILDDLYGNTDSNA